MDQVPKKVQQALWDVDGGCIPVDVRSDYSAEEMEEVDQRWPVVIRELNRLRAGAGKGLVSYSAWQWRNKHLFLGPGAEIAGMSVHNEIQGLIDLRLPCDDPDSPPIRGIHAQHEGREVVYVEHLQTAPWNSRRICDELGDAPRFRGVGEALIEHAIWRSIESGCQGRIMLFSLPEAESFYDRLGFYRLGKERLMGNCMRFELTEDVAMLLLRRQNKKREHAV